MKSVVLYIVVRTGVGLVAVGGGGGGGQRGGRRGRGGGGLAVVHVHARLQFGRRSLWLLVVIDVFRHLPHLITNKNDEFESMIPFVNTHQYSDHSKRLLYTSCRRYPIQNIF